MKKTFKGFTLVECLVAMAILAIAGTLMAGIYANVASRNNFNTFNNASLSNQMAYIEKYEKADTVKISNAHSGTNPPSGNNTGTNSYIKVKKGSDSYAFPVDVYIMYSRDTHNKSSAESGYSQGIAGSNNNWKLVDTGKKDANGDPIMEWQEASAGENGRLNGNASTHENTNENEKNLRYKYLLGH